jgi:hypothetical protein
MRTALSLMLGLGSLTAYYFAVHNAVTPHLSGAYEPFWPVEPYSPVPACTLTQVHVLQRHGARYPTYGFRERIHEALHALNNATSYSAELAFLPSYKCRLGADELLPVGKQQ